MKKGFFSSLSAYPSRPQSWLFQLHDAVCYPDTKYVLLILGSLPESGTTQTGDNGASKPSIEIPSVATKEEEKTQLENEAGTEEKASTSTGEIAIGEPNSGAEDGDMENGRKKRAMSPGTLALMCDEQDTLFTAPPSPSGGLFSAGPYPSLIAERERVILSEFRDCLRSIVSVGKRRGKFLIALQLVFNSTELVV